MTTDEAFAALRVRKLGHIASVFRALIASHEKEKSAALACLRQMDKLTHENARLRKELNALPAKV